MRLCTLGLLCSLLLLACAPAATPVGESSAPSIATLEVDCNGTSTAVDEAPVQAREDGVHVLVRNTSGVTLLVGWSNGGNGADPGETRFVFPIPPGEGQIRCQRATEDPGAQGGWATFSVLAPDRWVSPDLKCPNGMVNGVRDYAIDARGDSDPLSAAKVQANGADVQYAGYRTGDSVTILALKDGTPTTAYGYTSDGHGGWLLSTTTECS